MAMLEIEDAETIEGIQEAFDKVRKWVRSVHASVEVEGGLLFSCYKMGRGGEQDDPIFSSELEPSGNPDELAQEILDAAQEDCGEFLKGKYRYVVRVDGVRARCVFTLRQNPTEDDDIDDIDEAPNRKGIIGQMMRHNEKIMRVAVGSFHKVNELTYKMLRDKDERIQTLEQGQIETVRMVEDLTSARHVRDIELRRIETKEKRMNEVVGAVVSGAPVLMNVVAEKMLTGKKETAPPPAAPSSQGMRLEMLVGSFMQSLTPEQFQYIVQSGKFDPMQILGLLEIAKTVQASAPPSNDVANASSSDENR